MLVAMEQMYLEGHEYTVCALLYTITVLAEDSKLLVRNLGKCLLLEWKNQ